MKIIKYILITIFLILLTGCETHKEISDLGMVSALGIEKIDNKYLISVQVANIKKSTKMGTDNSSKVTLYTGIGNTSFEAIREISNKSSKKLYFPHNKLIIISSEIINEDPKQIIDFYTRDNEGNMNAYVLISVENTPNEILSTITSFEDVPAMYIYNSLLLSESSYGNTTTTTFEDYVKYIINNSSPTFTKISLTNNNELKNNTNILNSIELPTYIKLGNILVFNNKKLTELTREESIIYNLLKSKGSNSIITLRCSNKKYYTLELLNNSSKVNYNSKEKALLINLNLTYSISEYNCDESLLNDNVVNNIKEDIKSKIIKEINNLINKSIQYKSNFINFEKIKSIEELSKTNIKYDIKINLENRGDLLNRIKEGRNE